MTSIGSLSFLARVLGVKNDLGVPADPGDPPVGAWYVPGTGVRRLVELLDKPLYYSLSLPAGQVAAGQSIPLFVERETPDDAVTNLPRGNVIDALDAIVYRVRVGFDPDAAVTLGEVMAVLSNAFLTIDLLANPGDEHMEWKAHSMARSPLSFFAWCIFPAPAALGASAPDPGSWRAMMKAASVIGRGDGAPGGDTGRMDDLSSIKPASGYALARLSIPFHVRGEMHDVPDKLRGRLTFVREVNLEHRIAVHLILDTLCAYRAGES